MSVKYFESPRFWWIAEDFLAPDDDLVVMGGGDHEEYKVTLTNPYGPMFRGNVITLGISKPVEGNAFDADLLYCSYDDMTYERFLKLSQVSDLKERNFYKACPQDEPCHVYLMTDWCCHMGTWP